MCQKSKKYWEYEVNAMKKKLIMRGLLGFPLGMAIGNVISITGSFFWGQGNYEPCVPQFVEAMGGEIYAVALQSFLCAILGVVFTMASVIWEMDEWNITQQTGLYFVITAATMMPIAYITGWMERSLTGFASYFGIFVGIFVAVWIMQYCIIKYHISKMNQIINSRIICSPHRKK